MQQWMTADASLHQIGVVCFKACERSGRTIISSSAVISPITGEWSWRIVTAAASTAAAAVEFWFQDRQIFKLINRNGKRGRNRRWWEMAKKLSWWWWGGVGIGNFISINTALSIHHGFLAFLQNWKGFCGGFVGDWCCVCFCVWDGLIFREGKHTLLKKDGTSWRVMWMVTSSFLRGRWLCPLPFFPFKFHGIKIWTSLALLSTRSHSNS